MKTEIRIPRNPKEARIPRSENATLYWAKSVPVPARGHSFGIRASDFFRISDFELRFSGTIQREVPKRTGMAFRAPSRLWRRSGQGGLSGLLCLGHLFGA